MKVVHGVQTLKKAPQRAVVSIGNFDGVHVGHRQIISQVIEKAHERSGESVIFTFCPHPRAALFPENELPLLTTYEERLELLSKLGPDLIIEEPFSREFSTIDSEQFFKEVLLRRLNTEVIVVGYDFAFGKERQGHLEALELLCKDAGVELSVIQPKRVDSEIVSSSAIRQHCMLGEIESANRLLGREFFYRGIVVKGEGRGRKLGFPTANLKLDSKLLLPYGVYATSALFPGFKEPILSITNIGRRPTFNDTDVPALIETHLIGQDLDLYGLAMEVRFFSKLRDECRFTSAQALVEQIHKDIDQAKAVLTNFVTTLKI